jgi:alpha-glucosidase
MKRSHKWIGIVMAMSALAPLGHPGTPVSALERVTITSPNGTIRFTADLSPAGHLQWSATLDGRPVIEASVLGIAVDGTDLGQGAQIQGEERYRISETYPWLGAHSTAVSRSNGSRLAIRHAGQPYTIDVRVADDAVAFRFLVPGQGRRVPDAATTFRPPRGSIVWSHGLRDHYEALYERRAIESIAAGQWAAPPVTFKLPDNRGYAAITEADLRSYAGMALLADGNGSFREQLGHTHPPSYPFTLRYGEENGKRLAVPAAIDGPIATPWRVVLVGRDLDTLVRSDAIPNLCPPPNKTLFPQGARTAWLKPGRAVWRYLDGGESTVAGIKEFSKLASELGFEYQVIEGQWARWSEPDLKDVIEYSRSLGVGLLVWRHSNTLRDPAGRRKLFASLKAMGIAGLKIDFFDHEAKEVIDLYQAILRETAEFQLLVNFHGANKPTGEPRTWPNEMTREGIYGLEHRSVQAWAAFNATFPFARMLAGHADYTPVVFGERRRETSFAHQIASAAILTSPLLVYGGHPASLLASGGADILKSLPSTWDETKVLAPSAIGELALFARRSGNRWFVAAMNGPDARTVSVDLAFLGSASYEALIVRDRLDDAAALEVEKRSIRRTQRVEIAMRGGGGFVMRLTR